MFKLKKMILTATMITLSLFALVACTPQTSTNTTDQTVTTSTTIKNEEMAVKVILIEQDQQIEEKELTVETDTTLLTLLENNFELGMDNGMIISIDGFEQDEAESLYWTYTINDDYVDTGAADTYLKDGDKIILTLGKFE